MANPPRCRNCYEQSGRDRLRSNVQHELYQRNHQGNTHGSSKYWLYVAGWSDACTGTGACSLTVPALWTVGSKGMGGGFDAPNFGRSPSRGARICSQGRKPFPGDPERPFWARSFPFFARSAGCSNSFTWSARRRSGFRFQAMTISLPHWSKVVSLGAESDFRRCMERTWRRPWSMRQSGIARELIVLGAHRLQCRLALER